MKALLSISLPLMMIMGCKSKPDITESQAREIIESAKGYPHTLDYEVFCADPEYATRLYKAGFEEDGLVRIRKTLNMTEVGSPLIEFTQKAETYFLPTTEDLKEVNVQRVQLGQIEVAEITDIFIDDKTETARIEYITTLEDPTPFTKLINADRHINKKNTIFLKKYGGAWKEEK